jgi:hypothetical protein
MQDKTAQLLRAMTTVQIENAVRRAVMHATLQDMSDMRNRLGVTILSNHIVALESGVAWRSMGSAAWPNSFRMRPNVNMLAAIGYAVDEMMATPADALEPHTVH